MIELTVDRIEDGVAVCETEERERYYFCTGDLPPGAGEGSALDFLEDGTLVLAPERTQQLRDEVLRLSRSLFEEAEEDDE